jgi:hypothetical protein
MVNRERAHRIGARLDFWGGMGGGYGSGINSSRFDGIRKAA